MTFSIACASAKTKVACSPTTSSVKIAGYLPNNSQVLKKGVQSIYGTKVSKSTSTICLPITLGCTGVKLSQSNCNLFFLASSIDKKFLSRERFKNVSLKASYSARISAAYIFRLWSNKLPATVTALEASLT